MSVALVLLPDFLLILVGALLARVRAFDATFWGGAERLVTSFSFPRFCFARWQPVRVSFKTRCL